MEAASCMLQAHRPSQGSYYITTVFKFRLIWVIVCLFYHTPSCACLLSASNTSASNFGYFTVVDYPEKPTFEIYKNTLVLTGWGKTTGTQSELNNYFIIQY